MIKGFIISYKSLEDKQIHLYFYPGIDDDNSPIYETIELTNIDPHTYKERKHIDGSIEYIFSNKNIIRFHCKLIRHKTQTELYQTIEVY